MNKTNKNNLAIRQYQPADHDAVVKLHYLALEKAGALIGNGPWDDSDLNNIPDRYLADRGEFIVGLMDKKIVCMGALRKKSETLAEIKRMRVHPDYQRRGLGQTVLIELERTARKLGYNEVCLDTTTRQIAAQKLYQKNGYHEVRRNKLAGLDIIFYTKKID